MRRSCPFRSVPFLLAAATLLAAGTASARPEMVGFYVPWDPQAKAMLAAERDLLTVFAPQWAGVGDAAGTLKLADDPDAQAILAGARRPPRVMPLVTNAHDAQWDAAGADAVLLTPAVRDAFVAGLAQAAQARGFSGYILDFENLTPAGEAAYPALVAQLRAALAAQRRQVWVTAAFDAPPAALQALSAAADQTVLMAYDQCWATSSPGPIAGVDWLAAGLASVRAAAPPARTVLALGSYAYDWTAGGPAKVLAAPAALALAQARGAPVTREPGSLNLAFDYRDDAGQAHQVWLADGPAVAAARTAAARAGYRSLGVWRLGLEDPAVWGGASATAAAPRTRPAAPRCEPLPR